MYPEKGMGRPFLPMKQTARIISTYSADIFGVCSALFELGGMIVMHDPSGCNSTYTTHDEPRWFDMDSQLYISGLTEMDAILGNDLRLVKDITETALIQKPSFICIVGSQIPALIGCDLPAVARLVEKQTGIPSFSLPTDSMHYYPRGVYLALEALAEMIVEKRERSRVPSSTGRNINILGLTPLDFSVNGSDRSIGDWLTENGYKIISRWAMGSSLEEIQNSHQADINLVVSYGGLGAARVLKREWGIPYVLGIPFGKMKEPLLALLKSREAEEPPCAYFLQKDAVPPPGEGKTYLIGESIFSCSLAAALEIEYRHPVHVICPMETEDRLLRPGDLRATDETDLEPIFRQASTIIADPLYRPICPAGITFIELPQEGFSGRLYRRYIPNLIPSLQALPIFPPQEEAPA